LAYTTLDRLCAVFLYNSELRLGIQPIFRCHGFYRKTSCVSDSWASYLILLPTNNEQTPRRH